MDMFTGLVETIGEVKELKTRATGARLTIFAPQLIDPMDPLCLGESIAVNGACLTVAEILPQGFVADILEETLRCTMFYRLTVGSRVNLERALRVGDRLGGHFVSGHIDEVGYLLQRQREGEDERYRIACSSTFSRGTIRKGSVTVSGTSLTICAVGEGWFEVALIPTTRKETILGELAVGDAVNLEADLIGAYVRKALHHEECSFKTHIAAYLAD
jgi:riboflavin synthase